MDFTHVFDEEEEDFTGVDFTRVFEEYQEEDQEELLEKAFIDAVELAREIDTAEKANSFVHMIRDNPELLIYCMKNEEDEDEDNGHTFLSLILEHNNLEQDELYRLVGSLLEIYKQYTLQERQKGVTLNKSKIQNWTSDEGMTPLEYSIRYGYHDLALLLIHNGAYKLGSNEDSAVLNYIPDKISSSKNCFKPALASLKRKLKDPNTIDPSHIELLETLIDRLCSYKSCLFFSLLQEIGVYYPLDTDSLIDFYQFV
jgi:hypothetical protein